jgi:ClpP class serine protease
MSQQAFLIREAHFDEYLPKLEQVNNAAPPASIVEDRLTKMMRNRFKAFDTLETSDGIVTSELEMGVQVYTISGPIFKNSWYSGTLSLIDDMRYCDKDPSVVAHVIEIDSGGGEATHVDIVANFIRNELTKPVLAHVNGFACSAAYYLISGCSKIYASQSIDTFGSIGVMISLTDNTKYLEQNGIVRKTIYATDSTDKNRLDREAQNGNVVPLQEEYLDPILAQFRATVLKMRPKIKDDGRVFKGEEYLTPAALEISLIDGTKTIKEVCLEAYNMGLKVLQKKNAQPNVPPLPAFPNINNTFNPNMSKLFFPHTAKAAGMTGSEYESQDGFVSIPVADLQRIEQALATNNGTPATLAVAKPAYPDTSSDDFKAILDSAISKHPLFAKLTELEEKNKELEAKVIAFGKEPGADTLRVPTGAAEPMSAKDKALADAKAQVAATNFN